MIIAAIDEVGRGPIAGPVVAVAVILTKKALPNELYDAIRDSKQLNSRTREQLAQELMRHVPYGIGAVSSRLIDRLNILQATLLAMQRAWHRLPLKPQLTLIDGTHAPELPCATRTIIKGDEKDKGIAAASIIAKVTRDRLMTRLSARYPAYQWQRNAGYPTVAHRAALAEGLSPHHRLSFRPCHRHVIES
ncbi:MAG: ribonuclease HII [Alphaproteobacteria bacterium GM202ARS2]|nr:ribonuclease HII [Alphaproteobacteria bacterium GM202ARS2]